MYELIEIQKQKDQFKDYLSQASQHLNENDTGKAGADAGKAGGGMGVGPGDDKSVHSKQAGGSTMDESSANFDSVPEDAERTITEVMASYQLDKTTLKIDALIANGMDYRNAGLLTKAMITCQEATALIVDHYGDAHPAVAVGLQQESSIYEDMQNYPAAIEKLHEALKILLKAYGPLPPPHEELSPMHELKAIKQRLYSSSTNLGSWFDTIDVDGNVFRMTTIHSFTHMCIGFYLSVVHRMYISHNRISYTLYIFYVCVHVSMYERLSGSGAIDIPEFAQIVQRIIPDITRVQLRSLMILADDDGSGEMSKSEFLEFLSPNAIVDEEELAPHHNSEDEEPLIDFGECNEYLACTYLHLGLNHMRISEYSKALEYLDMAYEQYMNIASLYKSHKIPVPAVNKQGGDKAGGEDGDMDEHRQEDDEGLGLDGDDDDGQEGMDDRAREEKERKEKMYAEHDPASPDR